jgi:Flp pilus assembly protein TadG
MRTIRPHATTRRSRREDGQAYVEFALVLPILLLVVMGIIQFGTAFKDYIALTDSVRVGARQASVSRSIADPNQRVPIIVQKMKDAAGTLDTSKLVITVTPYDPVTNTASWAPSGDVTVRASYPFKINLFGMVLFDTTMNSRTTERVE